MLKLTPTSPALRWLRAASALVTVALAANACMPNAEQGSCTLDSECVGRNEVCNTLDAVCEDGPDAPASSGTVPSGAFTANLPFNRGTLCAPEEIAQGDALPVHLAVCVHPCMQVDSYKSKFAYSCHNGLCDVIVTGWLAVTGDQCPADAFGDFSDPCTYINIDSSVGGSNPLPGGISTVEVPALSNADVTELMSMGQVTVSALRPLYWDTPFDPTRTRTVQVVPGGKSAPAACDTGCSCTTF